MPRAPGCVVLHTLLLPPQRTHAAAAAGPQPDSARMCAPAAGPFYRAAGMSYLKYANICADLLRAVMKEPHKTKAASRSSIYFRASTWAEGKQGKPGQLPEHAGAARRARPRPGRPSGRG